EAHARSADARQRQTIRVVDGFVAQPVEFLDVNRGRRKSREIRLARGRRIRGDLTFVQRSQVVTPTGTRVRDVPDAWIGDARARWRQVTVIEHRDHEELMTQ